MSHSPQLQQRLTDALVAKGADYRPRTRHLNENGRPLYINRLILEDSPYLLQHAHNPVNWYSWSEEAFADARGQEKPIFLSIGYATCHWCHVMEEQSFESTTVAKLLNENFICIKVDREQHPDIDATYMTAVTLFTGQGGWPMSSFLCPDGKPFFCGTYYSQSSFIDLLTQISRVWQEQRETLVSQAEQLAEAVELTSVSREQTEAIEKNLTFTAIDTILNNYDTRFGGFSSAPKFPHEPLLLLILQVLQREPNQQLSTALEHTLTAMAQGGIYDQVGGGFHRYAVDPYWLVPHFEKMLYNQAYLARVYLQAFCLTGRSLFVRIVRQTLDYILREMIDHRGLFYSATDADSEGHEGTYFVWSIDEIHDLLEADDANFIVELFGMTPEGNFEGKNILFLPRPLTSVSQEQGLSPEQLCRRLDPLLEQMRQHRRHRIPPLTDDKILVSWNGMMITALAEAGHFLQAPEYIRAAERAACALWQSQRHGENQLWRVNLGGKASVSARQDDYAHLAEALLALYDVTSRSDYLLKARQLADEMLDQFLDTAGGTLYMGNEPLLFTQPKDSYDGALPSGNAIAVRVLSRLFKRTGQTAYLQHARAILQCYASHMNRQPISYAYMLAQADELNRGEIADYQYVAHGAIKIVATTEVSAIAHTLRLGFLLETGWHLNKQTEISVANPESWAIQETSKEPHNRLNREFVITAARQNPLPQLRLEIKVHPCNQRLCLAEEQVSLFICLSTE